MIAPLLRFRSSFFFSHSVPCRNETPILIATRLTCAPPQPAGPGRDALVKPTDDTRNPASRR